MNHGPAMVWGLSELVHEKRPCHWHSHPADRLQCLLPWPDLNLWPGTETLLQATVGHGHLRPVKAMGSASGRAVIAPCDSGGTQQSEMRRCRSRPNCHSPQLSRLACGKPHSSSPDSC
ncbi:unnamed protein product, partial [Rangifer tarandus platyrhynchus]